MATSIANISSNRANPGNLASAADRSYALEVMRSPLVQRLQAAGLIDCNAANICEWVQEWRQLGGSFSNLFAERACLSLQTLKFFSQEKPVLTTGRRIGDYLVAAGLVSRFAIRQVLSEIKHSGRKQLLGQALAERKHISTHTANYFANRFTQTGQPPQSSPAPSFSHCMTTAKVHKSSYNLDEFFQAAAGAVIHSRRIMPHIKQEAAEILAAYPHHCKVKYWCARLGVTSPETSAKL